MKKTRKVQYIVLTVLLLWAFAAQLSYSGYEIYAQSDTQLPAFPFYVKEFTRKIVSLWPDYANSGLKIGDDVMALNGKPIRGVKQILDERFRLRPGDALTVTVRRTISARTETLNIPIRLRAPSSLSIGWVWVVGVGVFLPLSCLVIGFYIAFARPYDPLAWITMAMLAAMGQIAGSGYSWAIWPPWRELLIAYHAPLANLWPVFLVMFALYFPVPYAFIKRNSWVNWILALPCIALSVIELYAEFMVGNHYDRLGWVIAFNQATSGSTYVFFSGYISAFFMLLGFKHGVVETPDARRRLNVMLAGCSLAFLPLIPVVLVQFNLIPQFAAWLQTICVLMLIFFPLTMAYVIVVQRAMDVRMVVRSGVRYAVASTGVKVLRTALIVATVITTIRLAMGREVWEAILIGLIGVLLVMGFRRITMRLSNWMDRRFFREAYNAETILTQLSNSVAGIRDTKALLETVARRIADSLHVERIAFLLEQGGAFEPAYALGFDGSRPLVRFPRETTTVRVLQREKSPSRVYFDDPQSWVHGTPENEQTALQTLEAQLLLPVSLRNRMLGVISLGPKKSELPYSRNDLQLLGALASQTGLALENAELTESIRREIAQRERLDRELEIAREVQQRLFPQKLPCVKGLDFGGYCRPALGVGGDYYDFVHLPDDSLGIAIGDVSGKGIAAALMMASLQASLRGQTIRAGASLTETIQSINRLVYEASSENRYATFFYGQYEPGSRVLRYVNAGHNPPIVCRCGSDEQTIVRLEDGGTVVGLFPDFPYREAQVQLETGDLFVAFTDGISEAMNSAEEEFDEIRLIEAVRKSEASSSAKLITCILERVDRFTAGAPQHDDMTLVVMRVE